MSKALLVGRPRMAPTVSRNMSSLTFVMVETSMMMLVPLPRTLFPIPRIGMMTTLWVTNFFWRGAGHMVSVHYLVVRHVSASDVSPFHLRSARFIQLSDTCRRPFWCVVCVWLCLLFPRCSFASSRVVLQVSSFIQL